MALFKIFKGENTTNLLNNRPDAIEGYCYFTTNERKMFIDISSGTISTGEGVRVCLNAEHADTAERFATDNGDPIEVGSENQPIYLNAYGQPVACDEILAVNITGGLYDGIDKSLRKVGTTERPVYFEEGLPVECNDTLAVNISGVAATATKADKADKADIAELAVGATSLIDLVTLQPVEKIGDENTPVYFINGIPTPCNTLKLPQQGDSDIPIYIDNNGAPQPCVDFLPLSAGAQKVLTGPLGLPKDIMYGAELPLEGEGFEGQLFFLTGEDNGNSLFYVPEGGNEGESLVKNSNTDGDYSWKKISSFPKILTAIYDTSNTSVSRYTVTGDEPLKDGLTIAIRLNATSTAATSSFVLDYNNSGNKKIYDNRGLDLTYHRARANYILLLTYSSANNCWYSVANPESQWPISYPHTTADEKCYLMGSKADSITSTYVINTVYRNQNVYMNPSTGSIYANKVYGAVWNDYAEYRSQREYIKPGYCVASGDNGQVYKTIEKFQACDGIVSDTFGFSIGETEGYNTPIAVAGRVLAYCEGNKYDYHAGDTVCAGPEGKVCKMTREEIREYPDRIVGIVSEIPEYETWGTGDIAVDGRIWIKIK